MVWRVPLRDTGFGAPVDVVCAPGPRVVFLDPFTRIHVADVDEHGVGAVRMVGAGSGLKVVTGVGVGWATWPNVDRLTIVEVSTTIRHGTLPFDPPVPQAAAPAVCDNHLCLIDRARGALLPVDPWLRGVGEPTPLPPARFMTDWHVAPGPEPVVWTSGLDYVQEVLLAAPSTIDLPGGERKEIPEIDAYVGGLTAVTRWRGELWGVHGHTLIRLD